MLQDALPHFGVTVVLQVNFFSISFVFFVFSTYNLKAW